MYINNKIEYQHSKNEVPMYFTSPTKPKKDDISRGQKPLEFSYVTK